jgi:hypothetical protein
MKLPHKGCAAGVGNNYKDEKAVRAMMGGGYISDFRISKGVARWGLENKKSNILARIKRFLINKFDSIFREK